MNRHKTIDILTDIGFWFAVGLLIVGLKGCGM